MKHFILTYRRYTKKGKEKVGFAFLRGANRSSAILHFIEGTGCHIESVTKISKKEYKSGMKKANKVFKKDKL